MLALKRLSLDYKGMSSETLPDIAGIHHAFIETPYGEELAKVLRYERYNLDGMPDEEWIALLGADVNGLMHLRLTAGLARSFNRHTQEMQPGMLSDREALLLEVAAYVHDWGESIVGDITCSDKTDEHEAEEKGQLLMNLETFYEGNTDETKELIEEALTDIVFASGSNEKLRRMFNVIERIGYVRTALRAAQQLQKGEISTENSRSGVRWLIADVFANHINKLEEYSKEYAAVELYLADQYHAIDEALKLVGYKDFLNYADETQREQKIDEFSVAQAVWLQRGVTLAKLRKI